jgi:hypothetical protein
MKNGRNFAALFSVLTLSTGVYLLHGSPDFRPFTDLAVLAGATISALGLIAASWSLERHLFLKRLEQHVRPNRQT